MLLFDLITLKKNQIKKPLQTTNPYVTKFVLVQNAVKVQKSVFVHRLHRCKKNPKMKAMNIYSQNWCFKILFSKVQSWLYL